MRHGSGFRIFASTGAMLAVVMTGILVPMSPAEAATAVQTFPECTQNTLLGNDDGSTSQILLPFTMDFFGQDHSALFLNNNGNVTFLSRLSTYTPFGLTGDVTQPIIAPFFGDVDTRSSIPDVTYGVSDDLFCAEWPNVGYYSGGSDKRNRFQLLLVNRDNVAPGDFDIVFNYDQIQWETGNASGGNGGLGGTSAAAGFSNGTGAAGTFFELPGSRVNGAFLDPNLDTGLANNSFNSTVLGRWIFRVRGGVPVTTEGPRPGTIEGFVFRNAPGPNRVHGAFVQVCPQGGGMCRTSTSNAQGRYRIGNLMPGSYFIQGSSPTGLGLLGDSAQVVLGDGETHRRDLIFRDPPPGADLDGSGTTSNGVPAIRPWQGFTLHDDGCVNAINATFEVVRDGNTLASGQMIETPPGSGRYIGSQGPFSAPGGFVTIIVRYTCPPTSGQPEIHDVVHEFGAYIDPSGFVLEVGGTPIVGATVTLYRSDRATGPFARVLDGSPLMSPANRTNPDLTDVTGHFGWDVLAGYYRVRASAPGCTSPDDASRNYVESAVLRVPPPVTDLELRLDCDLEPPTITLLDRTATNEHGWNAGPVLVRWACEDPSGIASSSLRALVATEGAAQTATATCTDRHGNVATATETGINIDRTRPVIAAPTFDPSPNANGWYRTDPTVSFACTDSLSGVAAGASSLETTVTGEGRNLPVPASCMDLAGNIASASTHVSIDRTPGTSQVNPALIRFDQVHGTASDALSGVAAVHVTITPVLAAAGKQAVATCICNENEVDWWLSTVGLNPGIYTVSSRAEDLAGNLQPSPTTGDLEIIIR